MEPARQALPYGSLGMSEHRDANLNSIRWAVKCRAHRRDGALCTRWAIRGGYVCPKHGGASPQARRKARERLTEAATCRILAGWEDSRASLLR